MEQTIVVEWPQFVGPHAGWWQLHGWFCVNDVMMMKVRPIDGRQSRSKYALFVRAVACLFRHAHRPALFVSN